ncbi:MAG: SIMPL domain-containing protein [Methanomicrobiales archaeon]|nr:SIMPL domain-containing protein [Methanomicrobiales archaeon]
MMQKGVILCIASLLLLAAFMGPSMAAEEVTSERLIHTSAIGEVTTTPDRVLLSFAVETEHPDAKVAQQKNADAMNALFTALEGAGITKDEMETTGYSIYPVYDETSSILPQKIRLYRVTNTLLVTLKNSSRAGEIIDLAVTNGANRVNYIAFKLSDEQQRALRSQALKDAMLQTRNDAEAVAAAGGLSIMGVKEITISSGYVPPVRYDAGYAVAEKVATPIEPGDVKVTASVSVTYLCR